MNTKSTPDYSEFNNREEYDAKLIAGAEYFTVTEFLGTGKYQGHGGKLDSLKKAQGLRDVIKASRPKARLMIYAVNTQYGRDITVHVE